MKARRLTLLAALFVVLAGCGGEESTGPQPGRLRLSISTPNADDRAVALTITGPVSDIRAAAGYQLYVRAVEDRTAIIVVAQAKGDPNRVAFGQVDRAQQAQEQGRNQSITVVKFRGHQG